MTLIKNIVEIIWLAFLSMLKKSECMENVQERLDSVLQSVVLVISRRRLRSNLSHLIFAYVREISDGQFFNVKSFNELNCLRWKLDKFR